MGQDFCAKRMNDLGFKEKTDEDMKLNQKAVSEGRQKDFPDPTKNWTLKDLKRA